MADYLRSLRKRNEFFLNRECLGSLHLSGENFDDGLKMSLALMSGPLAIDIPFYYIIKPSR